MKKVKQTVFAICCIFSSLIYADQTIFDLTMEENSFFPRTGNLQVILPTVNASPYATIPEFAPFNTGIIINAQWESICSSNAALAGGELTGWLLGPVFEGAFPGFGIDDSHDQFRSQVGLGPGNVATTFYGVLAGDIFELPATAGTGTRFSCSGETTIAEFAILYIFLWPDATTFADKGFYIGDVFYTTEIGIQHYFLYNSQKLL